MSGLASVAHYVIERELGRGGMGVVYRALDTRLGRAVAVKSLPAEFVGDARWLARFRAEAQSLAAVNHPNIAAIYGIETDPTGTYLVLELADGPTLSERIASAPPGVEEALAITRQVALGIAEAHARGIVHRDLKPGNVKVRADGLVKVLDFGIAKSGRFDEPVDAFAPTLVQPVNKLSTVPAFMLGTPGYMSPEQARGQVVDQATDVWALGCVLYECLAHRMAFPGETLADVIAQTILGEPDWGLLPRRTPGRVLRLMQACLRKSAGSRGVTMQQAAGALEEGLRELSVGRVFMTSSAAAAGAEEHAPERGNVPAMERPLVGRAGAVGRVVELLAQRRLVAVTGGAGAGVRSVAQAAALRAGEGLSGGAWWVSLPVMADPGLPALLTAFALRVRGRGAGVMEELVERIGTRSMLVILDGCSHAPAGVAGMAVALLRACPNLRVLAVARGPLVVEGEAVVQVGAVGEAGQPPGLEFARLLLERAPGWQSRAAEAVRVAPLLKGWPGAVGLCAGLAPSMTPAQFEGQLRQRAVMAGCGDLEGASAERVMAVLAAWAVDVQPAAALALLMRAALFVGPFSTRALRAVGGGADVVPGPGSAWDGPATVQDQRLAEQLARLASAGLARRVGESTDAVRPAWALPDVVRREALQRLEATPGAQEMVRRGYIAYAQALANETGSRLGGPLAEPAAQRLEWEFADLAHAAGLAIDGGPVRRAMGELLTFRGLMAAG